LIVSTIFINLHLYAITNIIYLNLIFMKKENLTPYEMGNKIAFHISIHNYLDNIITQFNLNIEDYCLTIDKLEFLRGYSDYLNLNFDFIADGLSNVNRSQDIRTFTIINALKEHINKKKCEIESKLTHEQKLQYLASYNDIEKEDILFIIENNLCFLKRTNNKKEQLLTDIQYDKLKTYTLNMIFDTNPNISQKFITININIGAVKYSFYKINRVVFGTG